MTASRLAVLLLATLIAGHAYAQSGDAASAQALFEAGRQLMDAGRLDEACPKLEESQRLDPGGGTLLNLALCYEKQGRTASAWQKFKEALGAARNDKREDRASFAQEHITGLEPKLSRLTVEIAPGVSVSGLEVTRDGAALGSASWGLPLPVDPGEHEIAARAPNHEPWRATVKVGSDADSQTVSVPALVPQAEPAGPPPVVPQSPPVLPPPASPFPIERDVAPDGSVQRISGFVVGGVGIVAMVVGGVFGGLAISKDADADSKCEDPNQCVCSGEDEQICSGPGAVDAADLSEEARLDAKLANGFIFGGLGLVGVGLVVVLTAPGGITGESAAIIPAIGPTEAGLSFVGRF